ncbi:outer membrane lipid asymmetry maintenance protein MlaD [Marinicauda salina]|uniref:Outer membrane lipid asymmetry maintenance protein MlaD n=1 Tax=Marinicauda salina TaxID=2135793 RepID=A0A2U2BTJ0_9PROT|nr:outer membrane lipid asymmetry maintenance protein MlaD [Marinicauda salina]PWE17318.1 outer membrane lipid asymmetry maintenance protein MlaD [Marinicauda salina]
MRTGALLETIIGFIVLAAAGAFFAYAQGELEEGPGRDGYQLTARFNTIGDLARGAEVRVAGVPVGAVSAIELDAQTYFARTALTIRSDVEIPADSTAKIATSGLLGGAYVEIEPGGDAEMLAAGEEIRFTQGAVDLMDLIGETVMNGSGG